MSRDQGKPSPSIKVIPPSLGFPILVDEDIALDLLHLEDAYALFDLVQRNRNCLRQWLSWVDAVQCPADQEAFIRATKQQWGERQALTLGIYHQQQLVGVIGFHALRQLQDS